MRGSILLARVEIHDPSYSPYVWPYVVLFYWTSVRTYADSLPPSPLPSLRSPWTQTLSMAPWQIHTRDTRSLGSLDEERNGETRERGRKREKNTKPSLSSFRSIFIYKQTDKRNSGEEFECTRRWDNTGGSLNVRTASWSSFTQGNAILNKGAPLFPPLTFSSRKRIPFDTSHCSRINRWLTATSLANTRGASVRQAWPPWFYIFPFEINCTQWGRAWEIIGLIISPRSSCVNITFHR